MSETETNCPIKSKLSTVWTFTENVAKHCCRIVVLTGVALPSCWEMWRAFLVDTV